MGKRVAGLKLRDYSGALTGGTGPGMIDVAVVPRLGTVAGLDVAVRFRPGNLPTR